MVVAPSYRAYMGKLTAQDNVRVVTPPAVTRFVRDAAAEMGLSKSAYIRSLIVAEMRRRRKAGEPPDPDALSMESK